MVTETFVVFFLITGTVFALAEDKSDSGMAKESTQGEISCFNRCLVLKESVDCSRAHCRSIPNELTKETTKLILIDSFFKYIAKSSFDKVPNLQYLDLSSGQIENIETGTFSGLVHLTFLNLSFTRLVGGYPKAMLSTLSGMRELDLSRTARMLTFDRSILRNLIGLTKLVFGRNQLIEFPRFLDAQNNSLLPNILELNLEYNNIERISRGRFVGLDSLQKLNLVPVLGFRIHSPFGSWDGFPY